MSERLDDSRKLWDSHARRDPLWAILSDPAKKGGQWNLDRFFETGIDEIAHILYRLRLNGVSVSRRRAMDFGCGVGRLAQALALHFARVDGVDVSPTMVDLARALNRHGDRVTYHANDRPDLSLFADGSFDMIVSTIVLQHIEPAIARRYVTDLCRIVAPEGTFVFQVPARERNTGDQPPAEEAHTPTGDLPDEAYRASIRVAGVPTRAVLPEEAIPLEVELANASTFEWSPGRFGIVRLGNRWFDDTGYTMVIADDARAGLPDPMMPGASARLHLTVTAPREPGDYWCEIDLAHEGVVWFRERGSAAVRFLVRVRAEIDTAETESHDATPRVWDPQAEARKPRGEPAAIDAIVSAGGVDPQEFPMHGLPQEDVLALLQAASMDIVAIDDDRSCGAEWISYRYFARKRST